MRARKCAIIRLERRFGVVQLLEQHIERLHCREATPWQKVLQRAPDQRRCRRQIVVLRFRAIFGSEPGMGTGLVEGIARILAGFHASALSINFSSSTRSWLASFTLLKACSSASLIIALSARTETLSSRSTVPTLASASLSSCRATLILSRRICLFMSCACSVVRSFELQRFELSVERIFDAALVLGALTGELRLLGQLCAPLVVHVGAQREQGVPLARDLPRLHFGVQQKLGAALLSGDALALSGIEQLAPTRLRAPVQAKGDAPECLAAICPCAAMNGAQQFDLFVHAAPAVARGAISRARASVLRSCSPRSL